MPTELPPEESRVLRRVMAWIAFASIMTIVGIAMFSDELANQTIITTGIFWLAAIVLIWYGGEKFGGKVIDLLQSFRR